MVRADALPPLNTEAEPFTTSAIPDEAMLVAKDEMSVTLFTTCLSAKVVVTVESVGAEDKPLVVEAPLLLSVETADKLSSTVEDKVGEAALLLSVDADCWPPTKGAEVVALLVTLEE